jgi:uncharacterized phage protein gp47/JayE
VSDIRPPTLDARRAEAIVGQVLARRPGYLPGWQPHERGVDAALLWIFARYLEAILTRLNAAPAKNKLAFLDLLGIDRIPAQPARAPLVFRLADTAANTFAEAGTQVVAPPPPESSERIVFETERRIGLSTALLTQVVSLWPGRDAYIDHSATLQAGQPARLFRKRDLLDTPHYIYLAHATLLALAGTANLTLHFELTQGSNEPLDIAWEYWDGMVWRPFSSQSPECLEAGQQNPDSTAGLRSSGQIRLTSDCAEAAQTTVNGYESYWVRGVLLEPLPPDPAQILPLVESLQISTEISRLDPALLQSGIQSMLKSVAQGVDVPVDEPTAWVAPDEALFGVLPVDTSQTFYPLGQAPKPGDVFYFSSQEIFTKPGAQVYVEVRLAPTPSDQFQVENGGTPLAPEIQWEYWDGRRWKALAISEVNSEDPAKPARDFLGGGVFRFTVPRDMITVEVNGTEALWVRAYLVKEGYGLTANVAWNEGSSNTATNSYTYVIYQPPALAKFRLGYTWQYGPFHPDKVFTYNDFQYQDATEAARWPGTVFAPFALVNDVTPALYLGFDRELPVDRLSLYLDLQEAPDDLKGPALEWEYWDGFDWAHLQVEDETSNLRVPGMISWIQPQDSRPLARLGTTAYWLRGRLKEDGPPGEPTLNAIYANAVWAAQRLTVVDEPIGTSTGQPNQAFVFRQIPVLPGEEIEVRELAGQRANVEWRLLALELLGDDYSTIQALEDELRREGTAADIVRDGLRLRRDRNKRVTEVWVRWQRRDFLYASGPNDRHYVLERSYGRLLFGDDQQGKVPPLGAAIQARRYTTGGGSAGNVTARAISQLQSGIGGVEEVYNPRAAEGGADAESLEVLAQRGPLTLRHRGRAIAPADYETMAREASPAVATARALPNRDAAGRDRPGWLTLIIIPNSDEARPWPSFGLREQVRRYIAARAPAPLVAAGGIYVTGPQYQPVDVAARLAPSDPAQAGTVDAAARAALRAFFHPLRGGPQRRGWEPGRSVYLSDVAALLERVPGVDYVEELALLVDGGLQGEHVRIPAGRLAVAGKLTLQSVAWS